MIYELIMNSRKRLVANHGDTSDSKYHAMVGGLTGLVEFSVTYPLDFIKTRMQVLKPDPKASYRNVISCVANVIKDEGTLTLFRGITAPVIASVPSHAAYFVTYEKVKRILCATEGGYEDPVAQGIALAMAITSHNVIMNPAEVVKQRMQVYNNAYKSSLHCFKAILRYEGIKAFYRSLPTQMIIDAPYGAVHFVVYQYCQNIVNPTRVFDASSHILSGAIAGCTAAASTAPLDVCRTLLNTQELNIVNKIDNECVRGLLTAAGIVYRTYGIRGFFRGLTPRILLHAPSVALCWIVYEFFK